MLGLEILFAGDTIRSLHRPTFTVVGVLAFMVAVRTFLSWSLEVELQGAMALAISETGEDAASA